MTRALVIATLLLAALLEAGGDAWMRIGLQSSSVGRRALFFSLAAMVLFAYGWSVNAPPWNFSKLIRLVRTEPMVKLIQDCKSAEPASA